MSAISTHVLDTATGRPAAGIAVRLQAVAAGSATELGSAVTDVDGRVAELGPASLTSGTYQLIFDTAVYHRAPASPAFYPEVIVTFTADDSATHYHLPLLLSPFGYSTYRGS
jgi:5-hydroxyisourate hydrolase